MRTFRDKKVNFEMARLKVVEGLVHALIDPLYEHWNIADEDVIVEAMHRLPELAEELLALAENIPQAIADAEE